MAQYPQGIFQTIQWLLRKVKILALGKMPVYNLGTVNTNYTIQGRGLYFGIGGSASIVFPNPALYQGQTIVISNIGSVNSIIVASNAYTPLDTSGTPINLLFTYSTYEFISTGTKWVGGVYG